MESIGSKRIESPGYGSLAVSVFALTPFNIPNFPDRELVASPGASRTTLMMDIPLSLCGIPIRPITYWRDRKSVV